VRNPGRRVLEANGYKVLTAADGFETMEIYRSAERVDLMIIDMRMPRMGGWELMLELRTIDPDVRGLVITGYALEEDLRELREEGILGVIHKSFTVNDLTEAVRRVFDEN